SRAVIVLAIGPGAARTRARAGQPARLSRGRQRLPRQWGPLLHGGDDEGRCERVAEAARIHHQVVVVGLRVIDAEVLAVPRLALRVGLADAARRRLQHHAVARGDAANAL